MRCQVNGDESGMTDGETGEQHGRSRVTRELQRTFHTKYSLALKVSATGTV